MDQIFLFLKDNVKDVTDYMVGIQLHPAVMLVIFLMLFVIRLRFEIPEIDAAKRAAGDAAGAKPEDAVKFVEAQRKHEDLATRIGNIALAAALFVSVLGEFALYWPKTTQGALICVFMSIAQVATASIGNFYMERWGVMDIIGRRVQGKVEGKP